MAFTTLAVTGKVLLSNATPAAGALVSMTLSTAITDGTQIVEPVALTGRCDATGAFSVTVNANDDTTTQPTGTYYQVTITYGVQALSTFNVIVPHANAPTVNLFTLAQLPNPSVANPYVSQILAGTGITLNPAAGTGIVTISGGGGTLADTATLYVAASGSDSTGNGLTWTTAFATIQKAINSLPANGGIVEVGYGSFAGFSITSSSPTTQAVTVHGRGSGRHKSVTDTTVPTPVHPTKITSPVTVSGSFGGSFGAPGAPESGFLPGVRLQDFAIVGVTGNGLTVNDQEMQIERLVIEECSGDGMAFPSQGCDCFVHVMDCRIVKNGGNGITGGVFASQFQNCYIAGNTGFGYTESQSGEETLFVGCTIQYNGQSGFANSGPGPYTFIGCHIENNQVAGLNPNNPGGVFTLIGCRFYNNKFWHIRPGGGADVWTIIGCGSPVVGAGSWPLGSAIGLGIGAGSFSMERCSFGDPVLFDTFNGASNVVAPVGYQTFNAFSGRGAFQTQTLSANGAVTIDATHGETAIITLSANATSTTITNAAPGDVLEIDWKQDATGTRTYAWPGNCKFAGGAAPAASTTANYQDTVRFRYDGTNWIETQRSVGIH